MTPSFRMRVPSLFSLGNLRSRANCFIPAVGTLPESDYETMCDREEQERLLGLGRDDGSEVF